MQSSNAGCQAKLVRRRGGAVFCGCGLLRAPLIEPLRNVVGVGDKGDDFRRVAAWRRSWPRTVGEDRRFEDRLRDFGHNFLHRAGILGRRPAPLYGQRCYQTDGCSDVIDGLAYQIDARDFNPTSRPILAALASMRFWQFCAAWSRNICNGNRIDDRLRCDWSFCPAYRDCDRVILREPALSLVR